MFAEKKLANKSIAAVVVEITAGNSARSMSEVIIKGSSNREKIVSTFQQVVFHIKLWKNE